MDLYKELVDRFVAKISGSDRHTFAGFTYINENGKGTVVPRLMDVERKGGWCFYDKRDGLNNAYIRIDEFVKRYAENKIIGVGGYLQNGKVSSITFGKRDLFKPTKEFLDIVERVQKANEVSNQSAAGTGERVDITRRPSTSDADQTDLEQPDPEQLTGHGRRKLSLSELEERLARQREIGRQGESTAFRHECQRLHSLGCDNPVAHIKNLTSDDVGVGYDLRSDYNGETRHIEVKASVVSCDSFFISENERNRLTELGDLAFLYLVLIDKSDPKKSRVVEEIRDPFSEQQLILEPVAYRGTLRKF